ncbi:MAG: VCBS repeat-containing protein [Pseudomonadales bacterium]|nr:VCBS repeat-containing protein [Pseudomonadales bacterium]
MTTKSAHSLTRINALLLAVLLSGASYAAELQFTAIQPELFSDPYGQSNAWGDFDNDNDLDLVVVFLERPVRLYENLGDGSFVDIGRELNLPEGGNPRSVAWGDYDSDGDQDIYIGYADGVTANKLLENQLDSGVREFKEVAAERGLDLVANVRQLNFIDFDNDGDLDLHIAVRNASNRLYENHNGMFSNQARNNGFFEPRRTVGTCWFDMDADGDLDAFTTNQNGDRDGLYRNDGDRFTDVAIELDMDQSRRPLIDGGVGCAVTDFDNDGDLDLYVAEYGDDSLFRNNGDGSFTDVAEAMGVAVHDHIVTGVWGDMNNDGLPDLYTVGYVNGQPGMPDYLFINKGSHFENQIPDNIRRGDSDHGIQMADFDNDGDLDISLAANDPAASHYLYRNDLATNTHRSIQIQVLDGQGNYVLAGAEVRVYKTGTSELLGTRLVDTGSGYNAQNAMPVHIATLDSQQVDIKITTMSTSGRVDHYFNGVDVAALDNKPFIARVGN